MKNGVTSDKYGLEIPGKIILISARLISVITGLEHGDYTYNWMIYLFSTLLNCGMRVILGRVNFGVLK